MWSIQTNIEEPVPGCAGWVNLEISGMPSGPECLRIVPDWPNWRSASRSLSRWGGDQNNCNSYNSKDNINPKVIWTWRCISTVERRVASIIIMLREDPLSLMRSAFFFCGGGLPKPIQLPRVIERGVPESFLPLSSAPHYLPAMVLVSERLPGWFGAL